MLFYYYYNQLKDLLIVIVKLEYATCGGLRPPTAKILKVTSYYSSYIYYYLLYRIYYVLST